MRLMDEALVELGNARRELDKAHKASCAAMARFQTLKNADILTIEERIAARSLLDQAVPLCKAILVAMQAVPAIAGARGQGSEVRDQPTTDTIHQIPDTFHTTLPCTRTAKSLLDNFLAKKSPGVVATSARHGRPILTAIAMLLVISCPLSVKANTRHLTPDTSRSIERVIDALVQIESSGRPAAIGDGGKAVGLLQIHPVAVREANRLAGSNRWKLSDRTCPAKSRAMARTILTWHYRRGVTDPVELACRWNRPYSKASAQYRAKVRATLGRI